MSGDVTARVVAAVRGATTEPSSRVAAVRAIQPEELDVFLHRALLIPDGVAPLTTGLAASPGAAAGRIALTADAAMAMADHGHDVIPVRTETSPDDVHGRLASRQGEARNHDARKGNDHRRECRLCHPLILRPSFAHRPVVPA